MESKDSTAIPDDAPAREIARSLNIRMMRTLRVLFDAKRIGLISEAEPMLDRPESLRFRLSEEIRSAVLKMAGES